MSRYFNPALAGIEPYVPGEQPRDTVYIKLNTNESPYPPAPGVIAALNSEEVEKLRLYSDPAATELVEAIAERFHVGKENVFVGNGSDEVLAFAFYAYGANGFVGPEVSYGFYPVFADFFGLSYRKIALREDLSIDLSAYGDTDESIVFANPNAQTGTYLSPDEIEELLKRTDRPVVVDEAYIDFGGESVIPLTAKYPNLLVTGTFSKSRNLAGARIGFAVGDAALIADLNTLKFSFNPYNLNRLSILAGREAMRDGDYFRRCTESIISTREKVAAALCEMGYSLTASRANFLLARSPRVDGAKLYAALKARGILVRHLSDEKIKAYIRITVGTPEQMDKLLDALREIEKEATQ